jgi:hypothetical protein
MRDAQKSFFRDRSQQWLSKSKELERRVDKEVADILESQGKLFDD